MTTRSGLRWAAAIAMFVATVEVPTPPFGLWTATIRRARVTVIPSVETTALRSFDRWNRSSSASTRASSSRASNGLAMTSSAPASRKRIRSSTSSVWLTHRTGIGDSDGVARISRQTSAAVFVAGDDVDDHELVVGDLAEGVVRVGRDR